MFNPVTPYGYLLPTIYLFVADIVNPDLFACGCRTWICLDITRFLRGGVPTIQRDRIGGLSKHSGKSGNIDTIFTAET